MPELVFLNPGLLWGILGAVIPIAIFLFLKRNVRVENWGATRFLKQAIHRKRRQVQIHSMFPLLLKILAIVAISFGAADPREQSEIAVQDDQPIRHRMIIADVSMSQQAIGEESLFLAQQRQLLNIVDQAQEGDSWQIVLHGTNNDPTRVAIPSYHADQIRTVIAGLQPTFERGDLAATLQRTIQMADEFPSDRAEILFVTDCQSNEWDTDETRTRQLRSLFEKLCSHGDVTILRVANEDFENLSIRALPEEYRDESSTQPFQIGATVSNHGMEDHVTQVNLLVNGDFHQSQTVRVASQSSVPVHFTLQLTQSGRYEIQFGIDADILAADNEDWTGRDISESSKVLVVEDPRRDDDLKPSDYLSAALSGRSTDPSSEFLNDTFSVLPHSQIGSVDLRQFQVVFLCGLPDSIVSSDRFTQFADLGGGLVISLDATTDVKRAREFLERLGMAEKSLSLTPVEIDIETSSEPFRFKSAPLDHPIVSQFRDRPESGFGTTRIYRYLRSDIMDHSGHVLRPIILLENGDPLMVEATVGLGRVIVIFTGLDASSGSWVLWPSFLPVIDKTVRHLSMPENAFLRTTIGEPFPEALLRPPKFDAIRDARNDEIVWNVNSNVTDWNEIEPSIIDVPGSFCLEDLDRNPLQTVIRTIDPLESDLRCLTLRQLQSHPMIRGLPIRVAQGAGFSSERGSLQETSVAIRPARWMFALALALLVIDQFATRSVAMGVGMFTGLLLSTAICLLLPLGVDRAILTVLASTALCGILATRILRLFRPAVSS